MVPDVDFELDTFQVILLRPGPAAELLDEATVGRLGREHIEHNFRLKAAGQLDVAGDPGVRAGLYTVELAQYLCPKGMIAFPELE